MYSRVITTTTKHARPRIRTLEPSLRQKMATTAAAPQWYDSFPKPQSEAEAISREEMKSMIEQSEKETGEPTRNFLLIDVRRNDHEGGTIRGSVNLPAQSIHYSLGVFYDICRAAGIGKAIFYCGSSGGRGTRCAAWFEDECKRRGSSGPRGLVLTGGIKGWVAAGQEYRDMMDGFDPKTWNLS